MYVRMVITCGKNENQPSKVAAILLVVSLTGKMNYFLSPFAPENLVSRDGFVVLSRVSLLISILKLNLVLA